MHPDNEKEILAELKRKLDSGEQPHIRVDGSPGRVAADQRCLKEFGLKSGQSVSMTLFDKISKWNIARR